MTEPSRDKRTVRQPPRWPLAVFYAVLVIGAAGLIAAGAAAENAAFLAGGIVAAAIVLATAPVAFILQRGAGAAGATPGRRRWGAMEQMLEQINEHSMLSDNAKRILFREREIDLLRNAIEVDTAEGKYNTALTLCDEMADVFGYREEAESFRARILEARQNRFDAQVQAALEHFDRLLRDRDWASVHNEAARIRRLFGDSHLVQDLEGRILQARDEHKGELEGRFLEAARRDDVEGAMGILKELDRYLDQEEAERLSEVAQGVVVRHRENLGVQFKMAVNDRRWAEAVRIGEALIEEFPNTKMAGEVRSMIEVLRSRASQATLTGPEAG